VCVKLTLEILKDRDREEQEKNNRIGERVENFIIRKDDVLDFTAHTFNSDYLQSGEAA
jgi:hypothetical protein